MACPYAGKVPLPPRTEGCSKKTMKAIVVESFGGPAELKYKDIPVPLIKENQVLIKVMTAGVNPADVDIRKGELPGVSPPYVPGLDLAGYVEQVGSEVKGQIKVGDPVYNLSVSSLAGLGSYAEYAAVDGDMVHAIPPNLNFSQAACLGSPYFSAYRALFTKGGAKPGDVLLVHGASGGVGMAACQFGRAYGLDVVGTAGSEAGQAFVLSCGAQAAFNHKEEGYIQKIEEYMGGRKFDLILEMEAGSNLQMDLTLIGENGRIIVIGCHGDVSISPLTSMFLEADIRGINNCKLTMAERQETAAAIARGAELGWLIPRIDDEFPLAEAQQAHERLMDGKGARGKIILSTV